MKRVLLACSMLLMSGPARAANRCYEVSDVVGERRCTSYGQMWSTERSIPLVFGIGTWSSLIRPVGRGFSDDAARFIDGPLRSYGANVRIGGYFAKYGYVALDWGLALGHAQASAYETTGTRLVPAAGVNVIDARVGPVFGARLPLGRLSLRLEGMTALQLLFVIANRIGPEGTKRPAGEGGALLAIEPRAALDWWFTPDSTLSAWAGANVLRPGDYSMGLSLAAHVRAFDGQF